ncbi:50S ribosomal protein L18 [Candidatus Arthromitus sp. SFB-rat-Yit]|uniref:50S ribosomal protein L18 n=1 Tax=Candidatus Arthromitus sp. SFB-rat-Yit TaxID=1041504 RepID=UPI000227A7FE|nr:50S ribosomal protein L18 [Candidatus Arthromitus sp. SFB-rat-Yit]BAK81771.1 50S ribosomal protein L18 [Candidatus Arthromitus sp. SFB-rat-Yit]
MDKYNKNVKRKRRHIKIRKKLSGTPSLPRLCVFRSSKNIYAQLIDDINGNTIVSASTLDKDFNGVGSNKEAARIVGRNIAKKALDKSITNVVFDRNGYLYHGRISELADGAREAGLQF